MLGVHEGNDDSNPNCDKFSRHPQNHSGRSPGSFACQNSFFEHAILTPHLLTWFPQRSGARTRACRVGTLADARHCRPAGVLYSMLMLKRLVLLLLTSITALAQTRKYSDMGPGANPRIAQLQTE